MPIMAPVRPEKLISGHTLGGDSYTPDKKEPVTTATGSGFISESDWRDILAVRYHEAEKVQGNVFPVRA